MCAILIHTKLLNKQCLSLECIFNKLSPYDLNGEFSFHLPVFLSFSCPTCVCPVMMICSLEPEKFSERTASWFSLNFCRFKHAKTIKATRQEQLVFKHLNSFQALFHFRLPVSQFSRIIQIVCFVFNQKTFFIYQNRLRSSANCALS